MAATPGKGYVFAWKDLGHMNVGGDKSKFKYADARVTTGSVTYPCYLKMTKVTHPGSYEGTEDGYNRQMRIYSGYYSADGINWTKIHSRIVHKASNTQRIGLFACSGVAGTYGNATFDFYRPALQATVIKDPSNWAWVSNQAVSMQTGPIPFLSNSDRGQQIRFKIKTAVPRNDYINHPGYDILSPTYNVLDGTGISAETKSTTQSFSMTSACTHGGIRIHYSVHAGEIHRLAFTVHDMRGRLVWSEMVNNPDQRGTIGLNNSTGQLPAVGMYVIRMKALTAGGSAAKTLAQAVTFMP